MSDDFPSLYTPLAGSSSSQDASNAPTAISAAQALEQVHANASESASGSKASTTNRANGLDLGSESAFPSLGGSTKANGQSSGGWGAAAKSRAAAASSAGPNGAAAQANVYTETLTLLSSSINVGAGGPSTNLGGQGRSGGNEPTSLGTVLQQLRARYPNVKLDASSSNAKGTTTFIFKAARQQDLERVKQDLRTKLIKKVNDTLQIPSSTKAFVIGAKGRTLKSITDETGVNIQIPRDQPTQANGASDEPEYVGDDAEDAPTTVTLFGDATAIAEAKQRIMSIVKERTSRTTTKITSIARPLYHLLYAAQQKGELYSAQDADVIQVNIPPVWKARLGSVRGASANDASNDNVNGVSDASKERDDSISITGDREAVERATEAINTAAEELSRTIQTIAMSLPKRQHRFITNPVSDEILLATGCSVEVPASKDVSDQITIRGPSQKMVEALQMVMQKANAAAVDTVDLSSIHGINTPATYARDVARYLLSKNKLRQIADEEDVQIFIPRSSDTHTTVDIVATQGPRGPAEAVKAARSRVLSVLKSLPPSSFDYVEIDALVHRFLIGRKGSRMSQFEEKTGVQVVFPFAQASLGEDDTRIVLVQSSGDPATSAKSLATVKEELLKLAKDAADVVTQTLTIPAKLHRFVIGPSGTTLNALIGTPEERVVHVKFGSAQAKQANETGAHAEDDEIVVRGPGDEVKRVAAEIERIAEEAKRDEIVNSHVAEFDIEQRFVSHIVGKGGAGVQKLRDDLGVRIDFGDSASSTAGASDAQAASSKKQSKSAPATKSHVRIQGRKENVEEAKRRILKQTEQLADEVQLSLPLTAGMDRGSLIGKQGSYVQRLETKYQVRINFPKSDNTEKGQSDNAIIIRGPKKGAEAARRELTDLMEYEKENNQSASLTAPSRALARILGRGGANIRELQEQTSAEIDVSRQQADDPSSSATVTIRGTKQAIASAKKAIQSIINEVQDEATYEIEVPRSLHVTIIGKGGSNIRDIITRAGGPSDPKAAAGVVRFPRAGEDGETVTIKAASGIAKKIKAEIEGLVSEGQNRIVYGVAVPATAHARVIGRGGSGIQELQSKHNVRIMMPGRNDWAGAGPLENSASLDGVPDSDIIKIVGSKEACVAAAEGITAKTASAVDNSQQRNGPARRQVDATVKTVSVPAELHSQVTQGGKFFRTLPSGVRVDHGDVQPRNSRPSASSAGKAKAARIDEDDDAGSSEFTWSLEPIEFGSSSDPDITWNVRGSDEAKVDQVVAMIEAAIAKAREDTHEGILTVPQNLIPRIVGRQGSGLDKLRAIGVSVDVDGRSGANTVIMRGTPERLEEARSSIVSLREQQQSERR